jgi:predicted transcriptional regulator
MQKSFPCVAEVIFSTLADKLSMNIITAASRGLKSNSNGLTDQSKKQYYSRLKRLVDAGLLEKQESLYKLTTFGSLVYENHFKTMEKIVPNYWQIKSIDVLKSRNDFPLEKKKT